jgi:hypothetical protein
VLAMKLISNLRAQGHGLTVADIFQNMRLSDAARVLKVNHGPQAKAQPYKPFSTLTAPDTQCFVSQDVQPKLANQSWTVQDVLPATEMQILDIKATIRKPRTSVQYTMMLFEGGVDRQRLIESYGKLVKTHDMLRTVFVQHESEYYQVVLKDLEAPIALESVDATLEQGINDLCLADADSDYSLGSPFLKASLVESKDGRTGLVVRLSHAQYDGVSLPRLLRDLETLYTGAQLADFVPFPAYIAAIRNESNVQKAQKYWSILLHRSSLSVLERTSKSALDRGLFLSKEVAVPNRPAEITTSNLVTAAWAFLLARSTHTLDVTFGAVSSGRNIDLANAGEVVGPCYNIIPVRVQLQPGSSYLSLLRSVQAQMAESTAYDTLGFGAIAQTCGVSWGSAGDPSSFDSIVHHQDFEDFDEMPFGDVSCKVDVLNPHGDAAYPFKAVSFVKQGRLHVGVVGSEKDAARVEEILEMFAGVVEEVAAGGEEHGLEMTFDQWGRLLK